MTLPSGTVTFLFTDIEGSTALVRELRDRYGDVLAEHQKIVRAAVAEAGGDEIDTQGDSFFFVFPRARDAVLAAANAQRGLAAHKWPEDGAVRVRMGIHTGEAAVVDGHYVGVAVHRAARISAIAHGGQVLLSQTSHNLLEDEEELPLDLKDLGEQRLKDFERPVRVYQLEISGLQAHFPSLRTGEQPEPRTPGVPRNRRRWAAVVAAGVVAAAAVGGALALTLGGSGGVAVAAHSVAVIDPTTNSVIADVAFGDAPSALAAGEGAIWVVSTDANTLAKIDPRSRKVVDTVALPGKPSDVTAGDGAVWVLHSSSQQATTPGAADALVSMVDPQFTDVQKTIPMGAPFDDITYDAAIAAGHDVWVATAQTQGRYGVIIPIDPSSQHVGRSRAIREGVYGKNAFAADDTGAWAASGEGVIWIDPQKREPTHIPGPGTAGDTRVTIAETVALGAGKVWVAGEAFKTCGNKLPSQCPHLPGVLWRIDPQLNGVDDQGPIGSVPLSMAVGAGAVWIGDQHTKTLWKIDPHTLKVLDKIDLGQFPADIVVANGLVWVAVGD